jgi:hypothetical protein
MVAPASAAPRKSDAAPDASPFASPTNFFTSSITLRGSTGLARYPSHPTSVALARSAAMACAVSATTGICEVAGSAFRIFVASQPSMIGMETSIRIRSG